MIRRLAFAFGFVAIAAMAAAPSRAGEEAATPAIAAASQSGAAKSQPEAASAEAQATGVPVSRDKEPSCCEIRHRTGAADR